jgi:hypothetical protein
MPYAPGWMPQQSNASIDMKLSEVGKILKERHPHVYVIADHNVPGDYTEIRLYDRRKPGTPPAHKIANTILSVISVGDLVRQFEKMMELMPDETFELKKNKPSTVNSWADKWVENNK